MFPKRIILFLFTLISILSNAQISGINAEIHYPFTMPGDKNNFSEVDGIFGGAFQFQFTDNEFVNYGIEYKFDINQSYQKYENTSVNKFNFVMNHINGVLKVNLDLMQKAKLYTDAGFTFYKYKGGVSQQGFSGFNVGAGLSYDFVDQFYGQLTYNYVNSGLKQQQSGFEDKEKFGVARITLGFKI
jgi:opacity protein-like surface antigen